mmetsp:Transcript_19218/g.23779  ORF Transcript_19218/g.23779 Transcript_19218/m.23779 type:complete len:396 (+) Transcript_19218:1358-2545(+)
MGDSDLTVGKTHDEQVSEVIIRDILQVGLLGHLKCLNRSLLLEIAQVEEASVLALATDDKLVVLVGHIGDGGDGIRVPVFLLILVVLLELATKTKTALALFLLLVLLLVLLHLELHHFHFPDAMGVPFEGHLERLRVVDAVLLGLVQLINVARLARDDHLGAVGVPLQVVHEAALGQAQHAQWLVQGEVSVAVGLKEEDFSVARSGDEHGLGGSVGQLDDGRVVSLEHHVQLDFLIVDVHHTHDTAVVAHSCDSTAVVVRTADQINAVSTTVELRLGDGLTTDVVPELNVAVLANSGAHVAAVADRHVVNATRVEVKHDLALERLKVELPETTLEVLHQPEVSATYHVDDLSQIAIFSLNAAMLPALNGDFEDFVGLSIVDVDERPPLDVAVVPG